MLSPLTYKKTEAYPGQYTPKKQLVKAMADGYFDLKKNQVSPKITKSETKEYYKVEVSVPGIKRENLVVKINEEGNLCIFGMQDKRDLHSNDYIIRQSRSLETFKCEIELPQNVDTNFVSAACHSGTLSILFTKTDRQVTKRPSTIVVY